MFRFPEIILAHWEEAKAYPSQIGLLLQDDMGWSTRKARVKHASECTLYISPCKRFLVKRPLITYYELPPYAIPTLIHEKWFLQPIANVGVEIKRLVWPFFKRTQLLYPKYDINYNNVGSFQGEPVLIDW